MRRNKLYNLSESKSGNEETGFLKTKGRISRNAFFLRVLLVLGIYLVSSLLVYFKVYDGESTFHNYLLPILLGVFLLIQGAKRMHDVDRTGWAFLIPVYNLYLSLLPGTPGNNSYGIDPAPRSAPQYFDELGSFQNNSSGTLSDSIPQVASSRQGTPFRLPVKQLILFMLAGLLILGFIFREDLANWLGIETDDPEESTSTDGQKNAAPTDITLTTAEVMENKSPGTEVGTLAAMDEDEDDSHTYALVSGSGDVDNESFAISDNLLTTRKRFDFESQKQYSIRVQVSDEKGRTYARELPIEIMDDVKDNLNLVPNKTKEFTFTCIGNLQEIKIEKYNNGKCDCPDGSDEPPGFCK
jgi:uncharacterized membrane protein YhaH (DUF805 family)